MRAARVALAITLILAACASEEPASNTTEGLRTDLPDRGWFYERRRFDNEVFYIWGDAAKTVLAGICNVGLQFTLIGGDYSAGATTFDLLVDDRRWRRDIFLGAHGRAIIVDDPAIVEAIAQARRRLRFEVGDWSLEVVPSPFLNQFLTECRAIRATYPDKVGDADGT